MTTPENKDKDDPAPYMIMEAKDEDQILAEMKGEFLAQFVYSFQQGNRTITNLSYAGIKEAIRRRGHYQIIEQTITEANGKIRVLIKVHDLVNDIDVLGASEAEADKPFAYVLAVNKAERNAFAKVMPAKLIAEMIQEKLHGKPQQEQPKDVTPTQQVQQPKPENPNLPDTVCPKCGGNKNPKYPLCFNCHEEEKANY